ncbi:MAG: hypothetical protein HYW78_04410 [Parcubacteria group bacterium]|nr:hypothetical protein [Parcubacteria group bacterium]
MKIEFKERPKLYIEPRAALKLRYYIKACENEISGLGKVLHLGGMKFLIQDIFILEQEGGSAHTVMNGDAVTQFIEAYIAREGNNPKDLKLWWHSHANMSTFFSSTDTSTMNDLVENNNSDYMIGIVGNRKDDIQCRIEFRKPFHFTVENIPLDLYYSDDDTLKKEIEEEVKIKVKNRWYDFRTPYLNQGYFQKQTEEVHKSSIIIPNAENAQPPSVQQPDAHEEQKMNTLVDPLDVDSIAAQIIDDDKDDKSGKIRFSWKKKKKNQKENPSGFPGEEFLD